MKSVPWLLTALPREHRAFHPVKFAELSRSSWRCTLDDFEFLLAETGVGLAVVEPALDDLAKSGLPRFVFLAGFGGALSDDLRVGDGVLARSVIGPDSSEYPATLSLDLPMRRGTMLTSDRLIGDPDEKRQLALRTGAATIDMETAAVAKWCRDRNIPWACLRVVTDDARTPVSKEIFEILEAGRVSPWRLTRALIRRPTLIRELLQLGRAANQAAIVIAQAFIAVVRQNARLQ